MVCRLRSVHTPGCRSGFSSRFYRSALSVSPGYGPVGDEARYVLSGGRGRGIPVCVSVLCCIHKKDTCGIFRRYFLFYLASCLRGNRSRFYFTSFLIRRMRRKALPSASFEVARSFRSCGLLRPASRRNEPLSHGNPFEQAARLLLKREFGVAAGHADRLPQRRIGGGLTGQRHFRRADEGMTDSVGRDR